MKMIMHLYASDHNTFESDETKFMASRRGIEKLGSIYIFEKAELHSSHTAAGSGRWSEGSLMPY